MIFSQPATTQQSSLSDIFMELPKPGDLPILRAERMHKDLKRILRYTPQSRKVTQRISRETLNHSLFKQNTQRNPEKRHENLEKERGVKRKAPPTHSFTIFGVFTLFVAAPPVWA